VTRERLREEVRRLMHRHLKEGFSGLLAQHYCYIEPSPERYPFQWLWDTCFHVFILVRLGEYALAQRALRSLFAMQQSSGFVGHMVFWKQILPTRMTDVLQSRPGWGELRPHMSALIQPPFAAQALLRLFEATGDRVFLGELYARVRRQHEWLARYRDFDGDGLLSIISPFESGMDWKPSFDPALGRDTRNTPRRLYTSGYFWRAIAVDARNFASRYELDRIRERGAFLVKEVGFNTAYALDLEAMETLARLIGDDPAPFGERRRRLVESMMALMYDERDGAFYDLHEPGRRRLRVLTPTIFFPLALREVDERVTQRLLAHFDDPREFNAPLPVPTVALSDPAFYPGESPYIWRGPTWAMPNWFLYHAFRRRGDTERAARLRKALESGVERSGFREYYDPRTGEGHGARDFTWSGLLLDMD
jgi:hypothetical protein